MQWASAMPLWTSLNEVRPRRPEQCAEQARTVAAEWLVSMKSGLEGRNNLVFDMRESKGIVLSQ